MLKQSDLKFKLWTGCSIWMGWIRLNYTSSVTHRFRNGGDWKLRSWMSFWSSLGYILGITRNCIQGIALQLVASNHLNRHWKPHQLKLHRKRARIEFIHQRIRKRGKHLSQIWNFTNFTSRLVDKRRQSLWGREPLSSGRDRTEVGRLIEVEPLTERVRRMSFCFWTRNPTRM